MDVDIACVGFGPASGGFLSTMSRAMTGPDGQVLLESKVMPGMPLQIMCYERSDDIGFGVSGVVTRARSIRKTFPDLDVNQIPMAYPVKHEVVSYLLDPVGASRRSFGLRSADRMIRAVKRILPKKPNMEHALELPFIPGFLNKEDGMIMSIGQFNQWVGSQLMASGLIQIWPGMPVKEPLFEEDKVTGIRLVDQGVEKTGSPEAGFMPGMDIKARLTVVADGPVGAVGQQLNDHFGMPESHHQRDWAVGMKMVVELPKDCPLEAGTVLHTIGYPEPEIFGFLYVYPDNLASIGIFVPTWFDSPVRTSYRYLQHWMTHPYLWRYLNGSTLRSWGAKSIQESGKRGEPYLAGDGYARIGEGSGSTNVLTGSGVDEAWSTGVELAEAVIELIKNDLPFTKENLEKNYVKKRRSSVFQKEADIAERARDGFQKGFVRGMLGMGITGLTGGRINWRAEIKRPYERIPSLESYYKGRISPEDIKTVREACQTTGAPLHDAIMDMLGWPSIVNDGKLLVSHQDALLLGGKIYAPGGYADHVAFVYPYLCEKCDTKVCIELCSGQAIMPGEKNGVPQFDREKCVHCGACLWNCTQPLAKGSEKGNIMFGAGAGGLHSAEN
ncbi:MAG: 4Fe-4S ferredoxin [Chlamydiota bacterium]|nr:4Fe-4S ferredoxin [Chlamydiota bacterium]